MTPSLQQAIRRARIDALDPSAFPGPEGTERKIEVAIGDPQAPLERFLGILDHHRLLGAHGRLHPEVRLVSLGDHFDFGARAMRAEAARSGVEIIAWLSRHPRDQTIILLGNHDLARVGELASFDADSFAQAQAEADAAYRQGEVDEALQRQLLLRYPAVPDAECLARDYSAFSLAQREWVSRLLRERRAQLAYAVAPDFLLLHAGVTRSELTLLGMSSAQKADATAIAAALGHFLARAVCQWGAGPIQLSPLHQPGSAANGEGRGMLYHRPSHPRRGSADQFSGPARRRFDPRELPLGLTQAIGHIRDNKCLELLDEWGEARQPVDGVIRHLWTDGTSVSYRLGAPPPDGDIEKRAVVLFADGGMNYGSADRYELLDLRTRHPFRG